MFLASKAFFAWIGIIIIPIKLNRFNLFRTIAESQFQWTLKPFNIYLKIHLHIEMAVKIPWDLIM